MSEETITKRRVEISVGVPDMLVDAAMENFADMPHPTECYFVNFVDVADSEGAETGFSAQATCLCNLVAVSEAWLQGASESEVQEVMSKHTGDDHG